MKNSLLVFITVFIVNLAVVPVSSAADNQAVIDLKKAEQLVASADLKKVNVFLQKKYLTTKAKLIPIKKYSLRLYFLLWTGQDLNPLPPRCKRGALPDELLAPEHLCFA